MAVNRHFSTFSTVQEKGLEPSQYCYYRHLKPARLPIPPSLHCVCLNSRKDYFIWFQDNCQGSDAYIYENTKKFHFMIDFYDVKCYYTLVADVAPFGVMSVYMRKCWNWQTG